MPVSRVDFKHSGQDRLLWGLAFYYSDYLLFLYVNIPTWIDWLMKLVDKVLENVALPTLMSITWIINNILLPQDKKIKKPVEKYNISF